MSPPGVLGVFFGKVTAMERLTKVQVQVLFYVLRDGGNILSRHTCEKLGIISSEFPKVGEHLSGFVGRNNNPNLEVNVVENSEAVYQEVGQCDPNSELCAAAISAPFLKFVSFSWSRSEGGA